MRLGITKPITLEPDHSSLTHKRHWSNHSSSIRATFGCMVPNVSDVVYWQSVRGTEFSHLKQGPPPRNRGGSNTAPPLRVVAHSHVASIFDLRNPGEGGWRPIAAGTEVLELVRHRATTKLSMVIAALWPSA